MHLTRQTEIAIDILVACAISLDGTTQAPKAAKAAGASQDYASQIIPVLVREAFIKAERGRNGGISLIVPPTEILLGDVLRSVHPDLVSH